MSRRNDLTPRRSRGGSRKNIMVPVSLAMLKAADLRGLPLQWWISRNLHQAAHADLFEARRLLEDAGFADRHAREQREADAKRKGDALRERIRRQRLPKSDALIAEAAHMGNTMPWHNDPDIKQLRETIRKVDRSLKQKKAVVTIVPPDGEEPPPIAA